MATLRYLLSKTTPKTLTQILSSCHFSHCSVHHSTSPPHYSLLRSLQSLFAREFHSYSNSGFRSFSSASDYVIQDTDSSVSTALNLDNRVPATVITGFLGSGKVRKKKRFSEATKYGMVCKETFMYRKRVFFAWLAGFSMYPAPSVSDLHY